MSTLLVSGLTFSYGNSSVLSDIALTLEPGLIYGVVGGSGAGKTTLIKCLLLLLKPSSGSISYFEENPIKLTFGNGETSVMDQSQLIRLRTGTGYVPQGSVLFPFLSLKNNICLPLIETLGLDQQASERRAKAALERVDMLPWQDSLPWQLSGGQIQRGAIARAVASEPKLLLLDEPTGALDAVNVGLVGREIAREARDRRSTVLVATHNLGFAQMFCDRLFVLKSGTLDTPRPTSDVDWSELVRELL